MSEWLIYAGLAVVGLGAGVINTIAGGGSLLTLPALIAFGLPANLANGTNRVGVLLGSIVALGRFRQDGVLNDALPRVEWAPAVVGALVGSWISVDVDEALFRQIIGIAMLGMLVMLLSKPKMWLEGRAAVAPTWLRVVGFFAIGLYGGFLQAGVGMFLVAGFVMLSSRNLVGANVGKVVLVGLFTTAALGVFIWNDLVAWGPALALSCGQMVGGWLGARWTVSWGPGVVRWILVAVVVVSSTKLLGLW